MSSQSRTLRIVSAAALWLPLLGFGDLFAGGPSTVLGNGVFVRWDANQPVRYRIDAGPLNATIDNATATQMVEDAFARWEAVTTSRIRSQLVGPINTDVDENNFGNFLNTVLPESSIVFDFDGAIIEEVFGAGQSDSVLGFAAASGISNNFFVYGFAVLNGKRANSPGFGQTITHELGHLLALDHTQANRQRPPQFVPLMFPFALNGQPNTPQLDDQIWISWLYPTPSFASDFGSISGRTRRRSRAPFQGAFVEAIRLEADGSQSLSQSVGVVSDFLIEGRGEYLLPGLPPGEWVVAVEAVQPGFTGGSSVGPFSSWFTDFPRDFFNGSAESGTDNRLEAVAVTVRAGQTVSDIDLVTNNQTPETRPDLLNTLSDDDFVLFEFPTGFGFPFFDRVFHNAFVHSDGNITFLFEEPGTTTRGPARLISETRIAPLFTDLDPSSGGAVSAEFDPATQSLRIQWTEVPEFGGLAGNTFAATLFSTGRIEFDYDQIAITPDEDNSLATVGISPGLFGPFTSQQVDLSAGSSEIVIGNQAILQFFTGSQFDLVGRTVSFEPQAQELFFPFFRGDTTFFTGFAVTDFSGNDLALTIEARDRDGELSDFPENPSLRFLERNEQIARVGSEFFGTGPTDVQEGWVRFVSSATQVASFFQFGNGVSGPLTQLDGGTAGTKQSTRLFFTRILQGPVFPTVRGPVEARTTISIANPNPEEIDLEIRFFFPNGFQAFQTVRRTLPRFGVLREDVTSLFGVGLVAEGHIQVSVTRGPGAVGFELVELPDSIFGLNAFDAGTSSTIYSAQLANGGASGTFSFTSLNIVNSSDARREVIIRAIDENGAVISSFSNIFLDPGQSLQRDASELFGLGFPSNARLTTGSIIVEADAPGIIGDIIFGDPVAAANTAALALQSDLFRRALFSQVANGATEPNDPTKDAFTGLAFFNPGDQAAMINIRVFNSQGILQGESKQMLPAGTRISRLVEEFVPETADLIGGYILIDSSQEIVAQQLFGNGGLTFLSAVPPFVLE